MDQLPLSGVRVLDLTRLLPGPYATLLLAELGAEVLKIETPRHGDPLRWMPMLEPRANDLLFHMVNRGKKSLTLNVKSQQGKAILRELVRRADVLLEGYRPGVMQRLGLNYDALAAVNPRLIYASLSGYGQAGPYAPRAGHDLNYIARSGLLALTGSSEGPPAIPGVQLADLGGALWTALGIVAALAGRAQSGHGQYLDVSMTDGVAALLVVPLAQWLCAGRTPQRGKMPLTGGWACYNVYRTSEGQYMALAALEPPFWQAFCMTVGREDWLGRQNDADQQSLTAELTALFATQPRAHWEALLCNPDCCCEPVLELDEALGHPQAVARGLLQGERAGSVLATPLSPRDVPLGPAPALGQHTAELLAELGYGAPDLERLRQEGVV